MSVSSEYKDMLKYTRNPNEAFQNAHELMSIGEGLAAREWHDFGQWWVANKTANPFEILVGVSNG